MIIIITIIMTCGSIFNFLWIRIQRLLWFDVGTGYSSLMICFKRPESVSLSVYRPQLGWKNHLKDEQCYWILLLLVLRLDQLGLKTKKYSQNISTHRSVPCALLVALIGQCKRTIKPFAITVYNVWRAEVMQKFINNLISWRIWVKF